MKLIRYTIDSYVAQSDYLRADPFEISPRESGLYGQVEGRPDVDRRAPTTAHS